MSMPSSYKVALRLLPVVGMFFFLAFFSSLVSAGKLAWSESGSQMLAVSPSQESSAAQVAMKYVSEKYGVPYDSIIVSADFEGDFHGIGRKVQLVTLLDSRPEGEVYKLAVDIETNEVMEDAFSLGKLEAKARQAPYGKLDPVLFSKLGSASSDDTFPVIIWTTAKSNNTLPELQNSILSELSEMNAATKSAYTLTGNPMDVPDPNVSNQIYQEYVNKLNLEMDNRVVPLVSDLKTKG